MTARGIVRAMHPRILAGLSLALCLSVAGAQTAPDPALEALLAERPASDTQAVRETLLQGDTPDFAVDLLARGHAVDARRWVLVEVVAGPVLTLLVDDGERPHVYRRSVSWHASMGHDNEKLVREVAPGQANRLWRTLQQHWAPEAAAASAVEGDGQEVILGIARMHDASGDRWRLLRRRDMASWHKSTAAADLLCSTLLAGLHCKPGMQHQVDEWFGEWLKTVSTLEPTPPSSATTLSGPRCGPATGRARRPSSMPAPTRTRSRPMATASRTGWRPAAIRTRRRTWRC